MDRALTIFFLFNDIPSHGGTCSIESLAPAMKKAGHRCHVFIRKPNADKNTNRYIQKLSEHGVPIHETSRTWRSFQSLQFLLLVLFKALRFKPNILHVLRADTAWVIPWFATLPIPVVYTEATNPGPLLETHHWYHSLGRALNRAALITTPSAFVHNTLVKYHHVQTPKKIIPFALPNFPNLDHVKEKQSNVIHIGTTCRLDQLKGIEYLIEAAAAVVKHRGNIQFTVWGSGEYEQTLKKKMARLGLQDKFEFAGEYSAEHDISQIMDQTDIYVLPSLLEGMPLSTLEAMAYAKPVISTDCGGVASLVVDGVNGFIVPAENSELLAERILTLADSSDLRHRFGAKARSTVMSECCPDRVSKKLLSEYVNVCENTRSHKWFSPIIESLALSFGKCLGRMTWTTNPDGLFLFFGWPKFGGAEVVHTEIANVYASKKPWIGFSQAINDVSEYPASGVVKDTSISRHKPYSSAVRVGYFSALINRHKAPLVFGSGCHFFYGLLIHLAPHVRVIDLLHASDVGLLESLPYAPRIDARVIISKPLLLSLQSIYLEHNVDIDLLNRVTVIENFTHVPLRLRKPRGAKNLNVVFIGRGCTEKRIHLVGALAKRLHQTQSSGITFIGDVKDWVDPEDHPYCNFKGFVDDREVLNKLLTSSDVIVCLSEIEGMPLSLIEGMAHGVVPISTSVGAIGDYIKHGENGLLLKAEGESSLVDEAMHYLNVLKSDRDLLKRLSINAYEQAKSRFDFIGFRESYLRLLEKDTLEQFRDQAPPVNNSAIAVLIYRYNESSLTTTLESILSQTAANYEIRIIDDCSFRDIEESARALLDQTSVHLIRHQQYYGYASTLNNLLRWSKAEILVPLRCGDTLEPDALQQIKTAHEQYPGYGLIQFPVCLVSDSTHVKDVSRYIPALADSLTDIAPRLQTFKRDVANQLSASIDDSETVCQKELELQASAITAVKTANVYLSKYQINSTSLYAKPEHYLHAQTELARMYFQAWLSGRKSMSQQLARLKLKERAWLSIVDSLNLQSLLHANVGNWTLLGMASRLAPMRTLKSIMGMSDQAIELNIGLNMREWTTLSRSNKHSFFLPRLIKMSDPRLQRNTGELIAERVVCIHSTHDAGHCVFGLDFYVRRSGGITLTTQIRYSNLIDSNAPLANIDVYDNLHAKVIAEEQLFATIGDADHPANHEITFFAEKGQKLEFRVWWYANCDLDVCYFHLRTAETYNQPHIRSAAVETP